jgi:hypothetical protein
MKFASTQKQLQAYFHAVQEWKRRGGLEGKGGPYDRKKKEYTPLTEPAAAQFNLTEDSFLKQHLAELRASALARPSPSPDWRRG